MVLLKADGREIAAWQYLYWLNRSCEDVSRQYRASDSAVNWELPLGSGILADYVKRQALENTVLYATVENWAEKYGCTLTEFVNRQRIDRSISLLQQTSKPVQEIAAECGIHDVNYFIKLFKKQTGFTPKHYRELWGNPL
jgi:hypothetical protein